MGHPFGPATMTNLTNPPIRAPSKLLAKKQRLLKAANFAGDPATWNPGERLELPLAKGLPPDTGAMRPLWQMRSC